MAVRCGVKNKFLKLWWFAINLGCHAGEGTCETILHAKSKATMSNNHGGDDFGRISLRWSAMLHGMCMMACSWQESE